MKTAFLSSTAKDLAEYRDAAYKAIEGLDDWHCVRMEDFGARDAMADEFCQEKVAECDLFVGIVGHCYGSSPKGSEKSYTEQEYDAAIATDKPRLMFLAPEEFLLPAHLIEPDERRAKQRAFRDRVNAERIRAPFTSPDALAWRIVQAIRNWERKATGIVQELFKGRVRTVDEELFQHPASEEEVSQYYDGAQPLTWNIIAAQGVIERDQQAELLERLITPSGQTQMICIVGESGAGKSSLAWQLARELTHQQDNPILQIWDNTDDDIWYRLPDFWVRTQQPFYVLVDDVFCDENVLRALKALDPNLPLAILATSRANEYRGDEGLPFPVERVDLPEPSPAEKNRILSRLGKEWAQMTTEERARVSAANQMLILMAELTTGKGFIRFIRDTLNRLRQQDEVVYRAYEYLCYAYQYDIPIPVSLLERLDDKGRFYRLLDKRAAKGLISADKSQPSNLQVGHPLRAEHAAKLYGRDPRSVFGEILGVVDVKSRVERRFVARLFREIAWRASETHLPDILEQNEKKIEGIQCEATINEMSIWRTLYQYLGRQREAEQCMDMALSKEPKSGNDCTTLLALYRERGQEAAVLPIFQQWLEHTPEDRWGRSAYLGLVERHAPDQVAQVIEEMATWLADHPQDSSVRTAYLGLVGRKGTDEQVAQVIKETGAWLADHPQDSFVGTVYLGLVGRKGTDEQVAQVIEETAGWLADHPQDSFVRTAYLGLVGRKGTDEQVAQVIEETAAWLADHPQDSSVRTAHLGLVGRKGTNEQVAQVIKETAAWLAAHLEDHHIRAHYLGLVGRKGTDEQAAQVIEEIGTWLAERLEDTNVRRTHLGLVERKGTDEQAAQAIRVTATWLADHPEDYHVRWAYLRLMEQKGTAEQVTQVIEETGAWLADHPEDYHVRTAYLVLVERHAPEQITQVIEGTAAWLAKAKHPEDNYVRRAYLAVRAAYLASVEHHTPEQVGQVIEDTSAWLVKHPEDSHIRAAYLGLVGRKGADVQIARAIEETTAWLVDHLGDDTIYINYLILVKRNGTDQQTARAIDDTSDWLANRPVNWQVLDSYLSLVKRQGTMGQKAQAIRNTKPQLPHCTGGSSIPVLYLTLISQLAGDKHSIQLLDWEHLEDARKKYECIVAKEPQNKGALYGHGRLLLGLEEFAEAAKQFRAILHLDKGYTAARRGLAWAFNGLGEFRQAEKEFKHALWWAENVTDYPASILHHDLGVFYLDQERYTEARSEFEKAIEEYPEGFANYWHLGEVLMAQGDYRNATVALQTALDKAPQDLSPHASEEIPALLEDAERLLESCGGE